MAAENLKRRKLRKFCLTFFNSLAQILVGVSDEHMRTGKNRSLEFGVCEVFGLHYKGMYLNMI